MMSLSVCNFNKIAIIESLPDGEMKTGKKLYDDIILINIANNEKIIISFDQVSSEMELVALLGGLCADVQQKGLYPIIHIECHGEAEKKGLILSNKDFISWSKLYELLQSINEVMDLNLLIVLAACFAFEMSFSVYAYQRAPFWGMLAPSEKIYPEELKKSFVSYYETLIENTGKQDVPNGSLALESLQSHKPQQGAINFISAEYIFKLAFDGFMKDHNSSKAIKKQAQYICNELRRIGVEYSISIVKASIRNLRPYYLERYHKVYFMIDLCPDNIDRFGYLKEDIAIKYSLYLKYDKLDSLSRQIIEFNDQNNI
jgi:hypothetical protein